MKYLAVITIDTRAQEPASPGHAFPATGQGPVTPTASTWSFSVVARHDALFAEARENSGNLNTA